MLKENFVGLAPRSLVPSFPHPSFSLSLTPSLHLSFSTTPSPSLPALSLLSSSLSPSVYFQNSGPRIQVPSTRDLFGLWKVNKKVRPRKSRVQGWRRRSGTSTLRGMKPRQPTECPESCTSPSPGGRSTLDKAIRFSSQEGLGSLARSRK